MTSALVTCGRCREPLPTAACNTPDLAACPGCGTPLLALTFPALARPQARGHAGEAILIEGEAGCFYHPQKKASVPCDRCGRFLCALCDVDLHGEHLCPVCLQTGQQKGRLEKLEHKRVLYDDIACALGIWPLVPFFWFLIPVTAPAAIYLGLRHWRSPTSVVPRTKARQLAGIVGGVAQLLLAAGLISLMVIGAQTRR